MKPQYERIYDWLTAHPGRYYPTWQIATAINAQDNSTQRALHQLRVDSDDDSEILREFKRNKKMTSIVSRPYKDTEVNEYAWVTNLPAHQESNNPCSAVVNGKTCGGFYYRGKNCTKCNSETGRGWA